MVVPIIPNDYQNKMQVATVPTELRFYIGTGGGVGTASGDGSGRNTSNYATLTTVMNLINFAKPAQATLVFPTGTYTFSNSLSWGGRLQLIGVAETTTIINTTNNAVDEFSQLSIQNLRINDSGTFTVNGTMEVDRGSLYATTLIHIVGGRYLIGDTSTETNFRGSITIDGGGEINVTPGGTYVSFTNLGNRGFKMISGELMVNGGITYFEPNTTNIVPIYVGAGGDIRVRNMEMSAWGGTVTGGIVIDPGGRVMPHDLTSLSFRNISGYGAYVHGTLYLSGYSRIYIAGIPGGGMQYGVILASGGSIYQEPSGFGRGFLAGASTSILPTTALYDNGGSKVILQNVNEPSNAEALTNCWAGRSGTNLFSDSPSGATNGNKSNTNNSSGWNWLRLYNQSGWTCTK
jgi:hypothetical protein